MHFGFRGVLHVVVEVDLDLEQLAEIFVVVVQQLVLKMVADDNHLGGRGYGFGAQVDKARLEVLVAMLSHGSPRV